MLVDCLFTIAIVDTNFYFYVQNGKIPRAYASRNEDLNLLILKFKYPHFVDVVDAVYRGDCKVCRSSGIVVLMHTLINTTCDIESNRQSNNVISHLLFMDSCAPVQALNTQFHQTQT